MYAGMQARRQRSLHIPDRRFEQTIEDLSCPEAYILHETASITVLTSGLISRLLKHHNVRVVSSDLVSNAQDEVLRLFDPSNRIVYFSEIVLDYYFFKRPG